MDKVTREAFLMLAGWIIKLAGWIINLADADPHISQLWGADRMEELKEFCEKWGLDDETYFRRGQHE